MTRATKQHGLLSAFVISLVCGVCQPAQAAGFFGSDPDRQPSVLSYAWRGMGVGAAVGTGGAYLVARRDDWRREDWKSLAYGAGFGALGGVGLGLTLGFVDLADDNPGMASLVLRDMALGTGLGAAIGLISGGLAVIGNDDWESLALGTSIGVIGGAGLGLIIGLIEGRRITESPAHRADSERRRLRPLLSVVPGRRRGANCMVGVAGTFD